MQLLILIQGADLQHFFRSLFRVRDHIMLYHTSHSVCNFHACFHSRCNISYTSSEFNADKERYRQAVSIGWFVFIKNLQADICCLASGIACYKGCRQPEYLLKFLQLLPFLFSSIARLIICCYCSLRSQQYSLRDITGEQQLFVYNCDLKSCHCQVCLKSFIDLL